MIMNTIISLKMESIQHMQKKMKPQTIHLEVIMHSLFVKKINKMKQFLKIPYLDNETNTVFENKISNITVSASKR